MPYKENRFTYGRRTVRRRSGFTRILDAAAQVITAIFALLLLCAYVSRYVDPNTAWFFAFAGLAAPILYTANLALALYWIIRWKACAFVPIAVLLLGTGWISLFFRPTFSKQYSNAAAKTTVVMSYNVVGFLGAGEPNAAALDSIIGLIADEKPDILCIQEFQCRTAEKKTVLDSLIGLPYNRVNFQIPNSHGGGWGTAIYSRFRIIDSGNIDFGRSTNSAMWADLVAGTDTVRVFNCHLQTTAVDKSDREYVDNQEYLSDDNREERVRSIASKLRLNFRKRAAQADTLAPLIRQSPYKVIVCGDFNDTPMSYAYHTICGDLSDSFVEKGRGIPNTYKGLFNLFRIDYILHSGSIKTVSYSTPESEYSDHKAVVSRIDLAP